MIRVELTFILVWSILATTLIEFQTCADIEHSEAIRELLIYKDYQISTAETEPVVVDTPVHLMGDASGGFEGDGLVGIEPVYCWVTHYGPPRFTADATTARCVTIRVCLELVDHYADEWGIPIDGFCAVSPGMPWYLNVRDEVPTLIYVEGHGNYLVLDRKGYRDAYGVDIYEPDQDGYMYCERGIRVWEVDYFKY